MGELTKCARGKIGHTKEGCYEVSPNSQKNQGLKEAKKDRFFSLK